MSETKGNQVKSGSSSPVSTSNLSSGHFDGPILVTATLFPKHLKRHPQHLPFGASLVVQTVKNLPALWEICVGSLGWEDPLEKGTATHSNILAWRIPWTEEQVGYSPWGHKESDTTEKLSLTHSIYLLPPNLSFCWVEEFSGWLLGSHWTINMYDLDSEVQGL